MTCTNCKKHPLANGNSEHCGHCASEAAKAPKMADDINNALERAGVKTRIPEEHVRAALLENAKNGHKSKD
jgi:hypothetical protein